MDLEVRGMAPVSGLLSRSILTSFLSLAIAVMTATPARAAAGRLDPSFGGDSRPSDSWSTAHGIRPSARTAWRIVRLTRRAYLGGMTLQPDGRIVLAGDAAFCCEYTGSFGLVRLRSDGTLDLTFGGDGRVITNFTGRNGGEPEDRAIDVAIQGDGRLVAVGVAGSGRTPSRSRGTAGSWP